MLQGLRLQKILVITKIYHLPLIIFTLKNNCCNRTRYKCEHFPLMFGRSKRDLVYLTDMMLGKCVPEVILGIIVCSSRNQAYKPV